VWEAMSLASFVLGVWRGERGGGGKVGGHLTVRVGVWVRVYL
jgi:hypothetical protein